MKRHALAYDENLVEQNINDDQNLTQLGLPKYQSLEYFSFYCWRKWITRIRLCTFISSLYKQQIYR